MERGAPGKWDNRRRREKFRRKKKLRCYSFKNPKKKKGYFPHKEERSICAGAKNNPNQKKGEEV